MVHLSRVFLLAACLYLIMETSRSELVTRIVSTVVDVLIKGLPKTKGNIRELTDLFILDALSAAFDMRPCNEAGKLTKYRKMLFKDHVNDEIAYASAEHIIKRSGFDVELHKVTSDDGYTTLLYHIINPLANRTRLKQPPIMMLHGGIIDPVAYLWASAKQHHPEKYPRTDEDGPITSSNRSLGFFLANNGYDVWLVGTRGANVENSVFDKKIGKKTLARDREEKNMTSKEVFAQKATLKSFWSFSFDELIQHEMPRQLDKILELTGAKNLTLFGFSYSGITTFPFLGSRPDIAIGKVHNFINMAPLLNSSEANLAWKIACPIIIALPKQLGVLAFTRLTSSPLFRRVLVTLGQSMEVRYVAVKFLTALLLGPSAKYRTHLELPVLGHVFQETSFEELQHMCQILRDKRFQKYDHGPLKNKLVYGTIRPPRYDVSDIFVQNWMFISATNDMIAPNSTIQQVLREVNPKPLKHLRVKGYNHLDLVAAVDNDIKVNQPILEFLDEFAY